MAKGAKKDPVHTPEEKLAQVLVPEAEQPYQIPENWCWVTLGNVTQIIGGGTPSSGNPDYYGGRIPWISPADLSNYNDMYISKGAKSITELGLEKSSARMLPKNTVCLSSRAPIGYVAIAANPLSTNQGFKSFLPSPSFLPQFLYWYLKGNRELLERRASGTTFLELSGSKAATIEFPIAPIPEQQRIVDRIESLFTKLDEAKEKAQAVVDGFEDRKAAILQKAFTGELTAEWRFAHMIKHNTWQKTTVGACSELITKGASPKWQGVSYTNDKNQTLFVTSENVREGYIDWSKEKYLDNSINDIQKRSILRKGDVLVNIVGASIGRSAIFNRDCSANINQAVCLVRVKENLNNEYLCHYFNSPFALIYYDDNKVETARANISLTSISEMPIRLPTPQEQKETVKKLNELMEREVKIKTVVEQVIDQIDAMKKSILARAFRGELGTNNPSDESAEELLKRIL